MKLTERLSVCMYVCMCVCRLLNEAEGSLLDDEHLLITLQTSKTTSQDIKEQLETAEETEEQIDLAREVSFYCSSVATGGGHSGRGTPPPPSRLPSTGMATGFVQIQGDFSFGGSDREGAHCAAPPQKPHLHIGPSGHVTGVPPNFEMLATRQVYCNTAMLVMSCL